MMFEVEKKLSEKLFGANLILKFISVGIDRVHRFPSRRIQSWQKFTICFILAESLQIWRILEGKRCTLAQKLLI